MSRQVDGPADDRGAVGHVHDAGIESQRTHAGQRGVKCFFLLDGLLGGEDFRRRDVRERARQAQVRAFGQRARERRNFRGGMPRRFMPVSIFR